MNLKDLYQDHQLDPFPAISQQLKQHNNVNYNYRSSGHYPSSYILFETQLNSIGLPVSNKKHITFRLQAQQVNAIYGFVTMVY
jgi:hypothetical protein